MSEEIHVNPCHHSECYDARLTRELEKKFADQHVVFVAQRRTLAKPTRTSRVKQKRPRSRTLTDVHDKILEDLVFPTEIVGKRTKVATDGSKLLKVSVTYFASCYGMLISYHTGCWIQKTPTHWSTSSTPSRQSTAG